MDYPLPLHPPSPRRRTHDWGQRRGPDGQVVVDVDNQTVFDAFREGKSLDARIPEVITTVDNKEADHLSRANGGEYARITEEAFDILRGDWGRVDMGFDGHDGFVSANTRRGPRGRGTALFLFTLSHGGKHRGRRVKPGSQQGARFFEGMFWFPTPGHHRNRTATPGREKGARRYFGTGSEATVVH